MKLNSGYRGELEITIKDREALEKLAAWGKGQRMRCNTKPPKSKDRIKRFYADNSDIKGWLNGQLRIDRDNA